MSGDEHRLGGARLRRVRPGVPPDRPGMTEHFGETPKWTRETRVLPGVGAHRSHSCVSVFIRG